MEIVPYGGWPRNVRLTSDHVDLIATLDVGPRLIHLCAPDGANVLKNYGEQLGVTGEPEWQIRGGHRLWVAPEHPVDTYVPDNGSVDMDEIECGVRLRPPVETATGIAKEMDIVLGDSPHVRITHRIRRVADGEVELAPWALSVMAPGGTAVVGLPPRGSHPEDLLPNQHIVLWPYTNLADTRLNLGTEAILLHQAPYADPIKLGLSNVLGWAAYAVEGCLFLKRFDHDPAGLYPDMGCNCELFTNDEMLEVESLGPLARLGPGQAVEHVETWWLWPGVPEIESEDDVDRFVWPKVNETA